MTQFYAIAQFWHNESDKVICELCPRNCRLALNQTGFCGSRSNQNNKMVLNFFNQASSIAVDPIEKKPLYHFYPGTQILSFGTIGCNLGCKFCQNWHISKSKDINLLKYKADPDFIVRLAKNNHCPSVAFTYNEPVIFIEQVIEIAKACKKSDLKTVVVTSGYITEKARPYFFEYIDAANVDLKAFSNGFYNKLCNAELQPVLDTLIYIKQKTNVWLELTTLIIPNENDSESELNLLTKWINQNLGADTPLHFSAFHPDYKLLDKPQTSISTLKLAREIALSNGLRYVYLGNI